MDVNIAEELTFTFFVYFTIGLEFIVLGCFRDFQDAGCHCDCIYYDFGITDGCCFQLVLECL